MCGRPASISSGSDFLRASMSAAHPSSGTRKTSTKTWDKHAACRSTHAVILSPPPPWVSTRIGEHTGCSQTMVRDVDRPGRRRCRTTAKSTVARKVRIAEQRPQRCSTTGVAFRGHRHPDYLVLGEQTIPPTRNPQPVGKLPSRHEGRQKSGVRASTNTLDGRIRLVARRVDTTP